jgi:hypothetical protein
MGLRMFESEGRVDLFCVICVSFPCDSNGLNRLNRELVGLISCSDFLKHMGFGRFNYDMMSALNFGRILMYNSRLQNTGYTIS